MDSPRIPKIIIADAESSMQSQVVAAALQELEFKKQLWTYSDNDVLELLVGSSITTVPRVNFAKWP